MGRSRFRGTGAALAGVAWLASLLPGPPLLAATRKDHASERMARPDPRATRARLQAAERDRARLLAAQSQAAAAAAAAAAERDRLGAEMVAQAARLRVTETRLSDAASRMDALAARQRTAEAALAARARDLGPLLPLIERLSLYPAETLLAAPEPSDQALRAVLVLRGLSRVLAQDAAELRAREATITVLRNRVAAEAPVLAQARAAQLRQAQTLDQALDKAGAGRLRAQGAAAQAAQQAAADAAQAASLRGVLAQIEVDRRAAEARARAEAAADERARNEQRASAARRTEVALSKPAGPGLGPPAGGIGAPVAGPLVRGFGDSTDSGPAQGVSYQPPPAARVTAPCRGHVVFAAPFRSFGRLLILDCGGGYHFVLAGLDRIDVQVGEAVRVGEPVGVMPGWTPGADGKRPDLYVELRHDGRPVNPAPWLKAQGLK